MTSSLTVVSAPATEPITLQEALDYLRVDNTSEDDLVTALIATARATIEQHTNRALFTQTLKLTLDAWPVLDPYNRRGAPADRIALPRAPLATVTSVKYYPADGGAQATMDSADYHVVPGQCPGLIALVDGVAWPDLARRPDAVEITYTAGAADVADIPAGLVHATRFLVAHLYEIRGTVAVGNIVNEIPFTVRNLLELHKVGGYLA